MNIGEKYLDSVYPELNILSKNDKALSTDFFDRLITAHQFRSMFTAINTFVSPGAKVLDWGCGLGHISYCLEKLGFKTYAYSLQNRPPLFDFMTQKQGKNIVFMKGDEDNPVRLPYVAETFESVLSCGVLEHVREGGGDELASLEEIKRILKKDGVFICAHFPNTYGLTYQIAKARASKEERSIPYTIGYHKFTFTKKQAIMLCKQSDLQLIFYRRYNFFPRNIFLRLSPGLGNNRHIAKFINIFDSIIELACPIICTSHLFVAKKR